ncbi:MAG: VOC family protein [Planctomycetota bacterium]
MACEFVWADLSTHDQRSAERFYKQVFGWTFHDLGDGYRVGERDGLWTAGLYPMPDKFRKIGMPTFWMSYIRVPQLEPVVESAKAHGGKVEVNPMPATGGGRVALIRDPAGAGFTCYEGDELVSTNTATPGLRHRHVLHVSSLEAVAEFYNRLFDWTLRPHAHPGRHDLVTPDDQIVAAVQVTPNELKGNFEYWGVYFAVDDIEQASTQLTAAGAEIVETQSINGTPELLAYDTQGAAFYITPPGA